MKRTLYTCKCFSLQHSFFVCADEEDLFIEVHLSSLPFWERVKNAIRYVFGQRSPYGDFEEIVLGPEEALDLGDRLVEWSGKGSIAFLPNDVF
jgi:hypothetical protein